MKQQEVIAPPAKAAMPCHHCKIGTLRLTAITDGSGKVIYRRPLPLHSVAYLDSG